AHGNDEEVAEAVSLEAGALVEAVLEQACHQGLGLRQRRDAVTQVPRWQDAQLLSQAPRGAAIVSHGDDGGEVAGVLLEAAQEDGHAGAAADADDLGAAGLVAIAV